jgi:hypothetical protein
MHCEELPAFSPEPYPRVRGWVDYPGLGHSLPRTVLRNNVTGVHPLKYSSSRCFIILFKLNLKKILPLMGRRIFKLRTLLYNHSVWLKAVHSAFEMKNIVRSCALSDNCFQPNLFFPYKTRRWHTATDWDYAEHSFYCNSWRRQLTFKI